jgi:hypothetical protein
MPVREDEFESVGKNFPPLINLFHKDTADKGGGQLIGEFSGYRGVDKVDPDANYDSDKDGPNPPMLHFDFFTFTVESVANIEQDSKGQAIKPLAEYTISASGQLRYLLQDVTKNPEKYIGRRCRITHAGKTGKMTKGRFKGQPCHQYDVAWAKAKGRK